jgi:hypothetical protein
MGCVFSFGARWSSSQFISYLVFFFFSFLVLDRFSPGPDLTHNYPTHFPTLISTAPTLVPYLLSPTDIATLIINYLIDLTIVLSTTPTLVPYLLSPTDIATLIISYLIDLTTVLTTYPTNLTTLHTQLPYWHKYFRDLITLIR